jgi:hypothetical protein
VENKIDERYNTKVGIPISVILETIFSDDNRDVETLCRWAKHYGFVDLIKKNENDKLGYYKLQDDYKKQSFYIWLSKEERKQYDYEDYLLDENEKLKNQLQQKDNIIKEVREYIERNTEEKKSWLNGIPDYRVFKGDTKELLEILDKVGDEK